MKKKEISAFTTWLGADGIVRTVVKPGAEITIKEAIENTELVRSVSRDSIRPLLVDTRNIRSISKEARDHFAMKGRKGGVNSIAMLTSSSVSKIIGNFFLGLNKPTVPTRLFLQENEAVKWLKSHL